MEQTADRQPIVCPNCGELVEEVKVCPRCQRPISASMDRGYFIGQAIGSVDKPWLFFSIAIAAIAATLGIIALNDNPAVSRIAIPVAAVSAIVGLIAKLKELMRRRAGK